MFVGHIIFSADKTLWHSDVVRPDCSLAGWVGVYSMPAAARYFSISSLLPAIPGGIMLAICALRPICGCGAALVLYDQYVARLRAAYPTGSHLGPRISRDTTHFVSKPPASFIIKVSLLFFCNSQAGGCQGLKISFFPILV